MDTTFNDCGANEVSTMTTLVIDLDGTLIDCNSFTAFVKHLFAQLPEARLNIFSIVLLRKLRLITHLEAKRRIVSIAQKHLQKVDIDKFIDKLSTHLRPALQRRIDAADRVILATAAPEIYVIPLARRLGINEVTATQADGAESRGTVKLRNVEKAGVTFDRDTVVITDHYDDLPLLQRNTAGHNILINPSSTTLMHLKMAGISFTVEN